MARNVVPPATNGNGQIKGNRVLDSGLHVASSSALSYQSRAAIYHRIPYGPCSVKSRIFWADHLATKIKRKGFWRVSEIIHRRYPLSKFTFT
tara:strand:+ start:27571 stop:27846 length:276 start_codon:yes stop_codon:yes gene_type:complete